MSYSGGDFIRELPIRAIARDTRAGHLGSWQDPQRQSARRLGARRVTAFESHEIVMSIRQMKKPRLPQIGIDAALLTVFSLALLRAPETQASPPVHQETRTGGSTASTTVATSSRLKAVRGDLYLAAISTKPNVPVTFVTGLGLAWTLVEVQCAGREQTRVEVWRAQGTPTASGTVKAKLASRPKTPSSPCPGTPDRAASVTLPPPTRLAWRARVMEGSTRDHTR
jgi:hypothetical protein